MGPLVGDLSADVAQCGYFGIKNGHVSWGRCLAGGVVEKVEKNENVVLSFSVNATKRPTAVRKKGKRE